VAAPLAPISCFEQICHITYVNLPIPHNLLLFLYDHFKPSERNDGQALNPSIKTPLLILIPSAPPTPENVKFVRYIYIWTVGLMRALKHFLAILNKHLTI
jgi:hypothetical protein